MRSVADPHERLSRGPKHRTCHQIFPGIFLATGEISAGKLLAYNAATFMAMNMIEHLESSLEREFLPRGGEGVAADNRRSGSTMN